MRTARVFVIHFTVATFAIHAANNILSRANSIEPRSGAPGTVLTVTGEALDKASIDEVYLTDHRFDMMVKVLDQTGDKLTIRIPPFAKPGKLQLLFLTTGEKPLLLEQPVYVQILEVADAMSIAQVAPVQTAPIKMAEVAPAPVAAVPTAAAPAVVPPPVEMPRAAVSGNADAASTLNCDMLTRIL